MSSGIALRNSETLATYWMPLAPTQAITPPHKMPVTMNGAVIGSDLMPMPRKMKSVEKNVATANQPTCSNPISSPGMT